MHISFRQIFASLLILTLYAGGLRIVFRPDSASAASAPNIVGYQGRVLNANGVPVTDASATMIFRLYDADSAGTCLWSNSSSSCASATGASVSLTDGMFAVQLGDTGAGFAAIPDTVFSDNATVYLQVTIDGETLSPRTRLTAAPYAMNSDTLDGVDSTGFVNTTTGCGDCLDFTSLADSMSLDANTTISGGASTLSMNLDGAGDFVIKDNGTAFASFRGSNSAALGGGQQIYLRPSDPADFGPMPDAAPFLFIDAQDWTGTEGLPLVFLNVPTLGDGIAFGVIQDMSYAAYGLGGTEPAAFDSDLVTIGRNLEDPASTATGTLLRVSNGGGSFDPTVDATAVAEFKQENIANTNAVVFIESAGVGDGLSVQATGSGGAASFSSTSSGSGVVQIQGVGDGASPVLSVIGSGTASALAIQSQNVGSAGPALSIQTLGDAEALNISAGGTGNSESMVNMVGNSANYGLQIWNAGSDDTRQGIYLIGCKDTAPTSSCNYIAFATGSTAGLGAIEGNGAGGVAYASPGSDYAELFPGDDSAFGQGYAIALDGNGSVKLAASGDTILGAYSVAPNTLGNWHDGWKESGAWVPVALLGQVPVRVSDANGPIAIGDYLSVGDTPGTLVRAISSGYTIGQALEAWATGTGTVQAFIRPSWRDVSGSSLLGSAISGSSDVDTLAPEASVISLAGARLTNVASISGLSGAWEITEDGNIRIRGRFTEITRGHNGADVETHGITSLDTLVQLSGSAQIQEGLAVIKFNDVDPKFAQVISPSAAYRVLVTPRDNVGNVYVSQSDNQGFTLSASSGGAGTVDYLVIAYNKDYEPENASVPPPAEPVTSSSSDAPVDELAPDPVVVSDPAPEPTPSDAPVESPAPMPEPAPEPVPEPVVAP